MAFSLRRLFINCLLLPCFSTSPCPPAVPFLSLFPNCGRSSPPEQNPVTPIPPFPTFLLPSPFLITSHVFLKPYAKVQVLASHTLREFSFSLLCLCFTRPGSYPLLFLATDPFLIAIPIFSLAPLTLPCPIFLLKTPSMPVFRGTVFRLCHSGRRSSLPVSPDLPRIFVESSFLVPIGSPSLPLYPVPPPFSLAAPL